MPFNNFIQSPIGLVPKAGTDQTRLIFHLSCDFKDGHKSVNYHTPRDKCSVHYRDIDYVVETYIELAKEIIANSKVSDAKAFGQDMKQSKGLEYWSRLQLQDLWHRRFDKHRNRFGKSIVAGKSHLKSAFRILGLSRDSWNWLVMKAVDPTTGETKFFVDKCLPFGASISCSHFQRFSNALCHLTEFRLQVNKRITNYLDDFLFIARTLNRCNYMIAQFVQLCEELGIPVSMEKTEWGSELMIFLGILLDGYNLVLALPEEKQKAAIELLEDIITKKKTTVKQLQKLCGFLNFIGRAVVPGRAFTRRMYAKNSEIINANGSPKNAQEFKWKQHYHVKLDNEFKSDCKVWLQFLNSGRLNVNRQMVELT